jgi:hypothetical protein
MRVYRLDTSAEAPAAGSIDHRRQETVLRANRALRAGPMETIFEGEDVHKVDVAIELGCRA